VIERLFHLSANGTTVRREVVAGITTFLTMAYIIFVQPTVLAAAGMDFGAVLVATCLASAFATALMAFTANYPIALAPGMGHNFFFTYSVVVAAQVPWQTALGAVAIAGTLTSVLVSIREHLIIAIPQSLKYGIAVGIGLLIATIGLQWSGVVVAAPGTLVGLGNVGSPPVMLALFGLALIAILTAMRVSGAILIGILVATVLGFLTGLVPYRGLVSMPPAMEPTLFKLDIADALTVGMLPIIFVFFFLDLFDSVGTLVGVAQQGGFMKDGTLPRARQALLTDAVGTVGGAVLGTSTITSYIESGSGIAAGGRTGLTSVVTAVLFVLALFFSPLVRMIGGGYAAGEGVTLYPLIAPALILVGVMMMRSVALIAWDDPTEAIPAFLTIIMMPFTISITEGIAFGFISYSVLKTVTGRGRDVHWFVYVFAVLFVLRFAWLR
jgi:AGZA family xanthine/uracil permease-like MFS transporter